METLVAKQDLQAEHHRLVHLNFKLDEQFDGLVELYQGEARLQQVCKTLIYLSQYIDFKIKKVKYPLASKVTRHPDFEVIDHIEKLFDKEDRGLVFISDRLRTHSSPQLQLNFARDVHLLKATLGQPRPAKLAQDVADHIIAASKLKEITTNFYLSFSGNPDISVAKISDGFHVLKENENTMKKKINDLVETKREREEILRTLARLARGQSQTEARFASYSTPPSRRVPLRQLVPRAVQRHRQRRRHSLRQQPPQREQGHSPQKPRRSLLVCGRKP